MERGLHPDELLLAPYPERRESRVHALDRTLLGWSAAARVRLPWAPARVEAMLGRIFALEAELAALGAAELQARAARLRPALLRQGFARAGVAEAFALAREATRRCLGLHLFPVQLAGGLALLEGTLVEMQTGEGKTVAAMPPAIAAALAGKPVHIVTVNDYLARRDAETVRPAFAALGLTVGLIQEEQDPAARRAAYACDVTYCTNKQLVFDYLKDRIAFRGRDAGRTGAQRAAPTPWRPAQYLLRGLEFAIVDEADSVLIDEARTPLIISAVKSDATEAARYRTALDIAGQLRKTEHFRLLAEDRVVELTPRGVDSVAAASHRFSGVWRARRARDELIEQALAALHLFERDQHYIVADGKIHIVDEYTGRTMPDRSWERGLHQLIEAKEECALTDNRESLAQITYQRFFRRYIRLAGMTGTATEVAGEMRAVYRLSTVRLPTNRPLRRRSLGVRICRSADEKWSAAVASAETIAAGGRPVLVGTRSVAASEHVGALLRARGLPHVVLNARQDADEATAIAAAGGAGRITVATNMAGRGTDIRLAEGVADRGGLHVILTEFHESSRIDRQLYGRAGRQGDPGSFEAIVALDDDLFRRFAPRRARLVGRLWIGAVTAGLASRLTRAAQRAAERAHARMRDNILRRDQDRDRLLAFAGRPD